MLDYIGHQIVMRMARRALKYANRVSDRTPSHYYFGFGANLSTERFAKSHMNFEDVGVARLEDHTLNFELQTQFKGLGYASVSPREGQTVWGYLCKLDTYSLYLLDIMEFVHFGVYQRVQKTVTTLDGTTIEAHVLVAKRPVKNLKPSKRYLDIVARGARDNNFSAEYIQHIQSFGFIETPEIDPEFTPWTANRKRFFYRQLKPLYAKHDHLRERILTFIRSFDQ